MKVLKCHVALICGAEWEDQAVPEFETLPPNNVFQSPDACVISFTVYPSVRAVV